MKLGILKINEVRVRVAPLVRNISILPDNMYMYLVVAREALSRDIYWDIKETLQMRRNETW